MKKLKEVLISVELWSSDSVLARREVSIAIPSARPVSQRKLTDASQRAVANMVELLETELGEY